MKIAGIAATQEPALRGSVNAAKNPTTNEPLTFTTRVPRGKNSPPRSAMNPDIQNRAPVPGGAAEHYQNITEHKKTPSCLEGVISSRGFLPHPREKANSIAEIDSTAWRLYINQTLPKTRRQSCRHQILCRRDCLHHKDHILKRSPK